VNLDEILVGSLALMFCVISGSIGLGPWNAPYQLRTFQSVTRRYGIKAARIVWLFISLAFLAVGLAVLLGLRPSYAVTSTGRLGVAQLCGATKIGLRKDQLAIPEVG
jgi:hypothetical protein